MAASWRPFVAATLLVAISCASGAGDQTIMPGAGASDGKGDDEDDETPDKPVPVSGAYLTCAVPEPKPADDTIYAGCQARDRKTQKKVDLAAADGLGWAYVPTAKPATNDKVVVYDLGAAGGKSIYYHAIFAMKLPPAASGGAGLTGGEERKKAVGYFVNRRR